MLILELAENKEFDLVGSEMLVREIEDTQDSYRKSVLQMVYGLCKDEIQVNDAILSRAEEIRHSSNIKYKDSIHLACAEAAGAMVIGGVVSMIMARRNIISNSEIQTNGLNALKEALGVAGTLKFLEQFDQGGQGDYTAEKYLNDEPEPTDEEIRRMFQKS